MIDAPSSLLSVFFFFTFLYSATMWRKQDHQPLYLLFSFFIHIDSITAGAHSSGPTMTYPAQMQAMLDPTKYAVTNLGACGSTMQKGADSPNWDRPQFQTLIQNKWDKIVIMLGTSK